MTKCWLWPGTLSKRNRRWAYGVINVRGKQKPAHRVMYELKYGPIRKGLFACHKCDVPACVRPSHIFIGTQKDNSKDASQKGRIVNGDAHWTRRFPDKIRGERKNVSKLTWPQVRLIRRLWKQRKDTQHGLGRRFKVSVQTINLLVHKKTWRG